MNDRKWSDLETGTVGDHEVDFKTSDDGHTLIADHSVNQGDSSSFDRQADNSGGNHDHYGSGGGPNDNGTDRGHYTGPGSN